MTLTKAQLLGSQTAKSGFANEQNIADKFNNWQQDDEAKKWLILMDYDLDEIDFVKAVVLHGHKTDVNVQITIKLKEAIDVKNIQVKLVSNPKGFNQVDKRPVDRYNEFFGWKIPTDVVNILKRFTGELSPTIPNPRDSRRMFIDEFLPSDQRKLFGWLNENRTMIVNDVLRGRGEFTPEWVIVAQKVKNDARWILKNINEVINHYDGDIIVSPQGSIKIGSILIQRKGGTPDPTSLQFKINPTELFDL
ncbi:MAG: hypothetical protein LBD41_01040 [Clostridiales Family XIII bacterium]|jgi:hypothetical protein|nr:hypothetical protein [Clostridiales Family XIII bacterium]